MTANSAVSAISVVIPTYNRAHCLERALNSVLTQTLAPKEVLVVDDGSTDATAELVQSWQEKFYAHQISLQYIATPNKGVSSARNLGIARASECGEASWLAFLDSDDEWLPHKLAIQMEWASCHPHIQIIHGEEIWIRKGVRVNPMKKHQKSGGFIFEQCLPLCVISPSAVMIRPSVLREVGGFDEDYIVCEDYELWLRIAARFEVGFVETPIIRKYGGHEDQLSQKYVGMDYWRIKALFRSLQAQDVLAESSRKEKIKEHLLQKGQILLQGMQKHNNMQNHSEITHLLMVAQSL